MTLSIAILMSSSAFIDAMDTTINRVTGENGAPALATTSSKLVDLFFQLVRGLDGAALSESFASAAKECKTPSDYAELVVLAFQTRSCRSDGAGKGEKDLFYLLLAEIAKAFGEDVVKAVLPLVSSYGYWKDLLAMGRYDLASKTLTLGLLINDLFL